MNKIIFFTGALATGKSTFSNEIAKKYQILCFNKDVIKENLSDVIGFNNRDENKKLSVASYQEMLYIFDKFALLNKDLILEANFHQNEIDELEILVKKYHYDSLILNFTGSANILYERFLNRAKNEKRNPCHLSGFNNLKDFEDYLLINNEVKFFGKVININADDFSYKIDANLLKEIENFLGVNKNG